MLAISVFHLISELVDLIATLVGRPNAAQSSSLITVTDLIASTTSTEIDEQTFNFGYALLRATQAIFSRDEDENSTIKNTSLDLFQDILVFKQALEKLNAQVFLVEAVMTIAEAAVDHAVDDTKMIATEATGHLRTLLGRINPQAT